MQDVLMFGYHLHRVMLAIQHLQIILLVCHAPRFSHRNHHFETFQTTSSTEHGSEHCHRMLLQAFDVIRQHFSSDGIRIKNREQNACLYSRDASHNGLRLSTKKERNWISRNKTVEDTERVGGLKGRPIMISKAVAELGQRNRVKLLYGTTLPVQQKFST
ncbi:hypothetical protein TNCV_2318881 [Trichonephila clavipes]|nr:hypothetical protein TNCV_2318881 [Trichonephila clavipes]